MRLLATVLIEKDESETKYACWQRVFTWLWSDASVLAANVPITKKVTHQRIYKMTGSTLKGCKIDG